MRQFGFTLLELLIGMVLLGMILLLLYGGLRLGTQGWNAGERLVESSTRRGIVEDFLHRQISHIHPLKWTQEAGDDVLAFSGERDAMYFIGSGPAHMSEGGIYMVSLKALTNEVGAALQMQWQRATSAQDRFDFSESEMETLLVSDLERVEFAYFGALTEESQPEWQEQWHSDLDLPLLVRLRLVGKDNLSLWPDIVITPMVREVCCASIK